MVIVFFWRFLVSAAATQRESLFGGAPKSLTAAAADRMWNSQPRRRERGRRGVPCLLAQASNCKNPGKRVKEGGREGGEKGQLFLLGGEVEKGGFWRDRETLGLLGNPFARAKPSDNGKEEKLFSSFLRKQMICLEN